MEIKVKDRFTSGFFAGVAQIKSINKTTGYVKVEIVNGNKNHQEQWDLMYVEKAITEKIYIKLEN